jgi:hypothetical protein
MVGRVEAAMPFHAYRAAHPGSYLAHAFTTAEGKLIQPLELGYYADDDTITVFKGDPVMALPPDHVFKDQGTVERLDLGAVRLGPEAALAKAVQEQDERYPKHETRKAVLILQQRDVALWNITLVTATLQMINLRIDAATGAVLSCSLRSIMDLAQ